MAKKVSPSKSHPRARSHDHPTRSEEPLLDPLAVAEEPLPGALPDDEPVGAPHVDQEPGAVPDAFSVYPSTLPGAHEAEGITEEMGLENGADEDLHALWHEREELHARNMRRLAVVVGTTMVAIFALWILVVSDSVQAIFGDARTSVTLESDVLGALKESQERLNFYTNVITGDTNTNGSLSAQQAFIDELKIRTAEAATANTSTKP